MTVDEAKKLLLENLKNFSPEIKIATEIILSELKKSEEKISELNGCDLPDEIWKDIEGYEGLYKISNFGRLKSFF